MLCLKSNILNIKQNRTKVKYILCYKMLIMKIVVEKKLVETKDIVSIEESGHRMHGFIIYLIDGSCIRIEQTQAHDSHPIDCANINDRYRALREKVIIEWEKDKTDLTILKL